MIVDSWTHITPPRYLKSMMDSQDAEVRKQAARGQTLSERYAHFSNLEARLRDLDKYGISVQVTMVQSAMDPNNFHAGERLVNSCKIINDEMHELMEKSKGKVLCLGTPPLVVTEDVGREEMRRAIRDLGLKGFMVLTNVRGKPIDKFAWFWEEAERLETPVYIHPANPVSVDSRPYEDEFDMIHVLGWPFESTLALSRLVFSGIADRNPSAKIIAHHLGGMIPFFAGRISESYDKRASPPKPDQIELAQNKKPIIETFKQFYYDTAVGGSKSAIKCGYEVFGASHLIFSTDYPWGPEGGRTRLATYPSLIRNLGISAQEQEEILESNIRKILLF